MITPSVRTRWHVGLAVAALVLAVVAAAAGFQLGGTPERVAPESSPTEPWVGRLFPDDGGDRP